MEVEQENERLRRRLTRERHARREAERYTEQATRSLYERNRELRLLERVLVTANTTDDAREAIAHVLDQVCEHLDWPVGLSWSPAPGGLEIAPARCVRNAERYAPFVNRANRTVFRRGEGLPGRVLADPRVHVIPDLSRDDNFPRAAPAGACGLRSAIAFPVRGAGEVCAVLEFFSDRAVAPSEQLLGLLGRVGGALAWVFERDEVRADLAHQAGHDALTGLPNRVRFAQRAERTIAEVAARGRVSALAIIDLDGFKEVNDTLGHVFGDELLVETAARLRHGVRRDDVIARLGGDEFALLFDDIADPERAMERACRLRDELRRSHRLDAVEVRVDASIGIVLVPEHGTELGELLRRADVAMYEAKRSQAGVLLYSETFDRYNVERLAMAAELGAAVTGGELVLHYQSKVRSDPDLGLCGLEALVRWCHPVRGLLGPGQFIALAERTGLIVPLTYEVLRLALDQLVCWRDLGVAVPVAVNLAPRCLHEPDLVRRISAMLAERCLDGRLLEVEVTESSIMQCPEVSERTLRGLAALGVRVAIDDFGTGYSSLTQLRRLPFGVLKIDRSFVAAMRSDARDISIVRSTITLAHDLGLTVVAEGVEDAVTAKLLRELGCELLQGFWIDRPSPAQTVSERLLGDATQVATVSAPSSREIATSIE